MSEPRVTIEVVEGDVLEFAADLLALKYAGHYYGSDAAISSLLIKQGVATEDQLKPGKGAHAWVNSRLAIASPRVLLIGVPPLIKFGYTEIEAWAGAVVAITARECPDARHIAITLHGPGYGLDEVEALQAEVRGLVSSLQADDAPPQLSRISIVERNAERVRRLQEALIEIVQPDARVSTSRGSGANVPAAPAADPQAADRAVFYDVSLQSPIKVGRPIKLRIHRPPITDSGEFEKTAASATLQSAEQVERKPRAFVAMPFSPEMEDVFYYGILTPVRQLGYVCERVDLEAFTGDILDQVKMRIENAEIVIADLTGANPNVYLEVGYAWGKGRPTVLVANKNDELHFDVRGQRCLKYQSIKDLESTLTKELKGLSANPGNRRSN